MRYKYNKLRGRIVEIFGSQAAFAEKIHTSVQTVSAKLLGRSNFTQDNILVWSEALQIDQNEIGNYFFTR